MRKIFLLVMFSILVLQYQFAQEKLDLSTAINRMLEYDPGIKIALSSTMNALYGFKSKEAESFPQITLDSDYSLLWNQGTQESSMNETTDNTNHNISLDLNLSQLLPSAGILNTGVRNTTSIRMGSEIQNRTETEYAIIATPDFSIIPRTRVIEGEEEEYTNYYHSPELYLSVNQPIIFNDKFIDMDLYPATFRSESLKHLQAIQNEREAKNQAIIATIEGYFNIISLRKYIEYQERLIELNNENLENLKKSREKGLVTQAVVFETEISIGKLKETLLDTRYTLLQAEDNLKNSLGFESLDNYYLVEEIPALEININQHDIIYDMLKDNPQIIKENYSLEQAELGKIISGQSHAWNLSLSFSLAPRYAEQPDEETMEEFASAFEELFTDEAGWDVGFSVGLKIPLYKGGKQEADKMLQNTLIDMKKENLKINRKNLLNELEYLLQKTDILNKKISLLNENIEFENIRLSDQKALFDKGRSTELKVKGVELDLLVKQNELWSAQTEFYLTLIGISNLSGQEIENLFMP